MFTCIVHVLVYVLMHYVSTERTPPQCTVIIKDTFKDCISSANKNMENKMQIKVGDATLKENRSKIECIDSEICHRTFRIARFLQRSFANTMHSAVRKMVDACCGECANLSVVSHLTDATQLNNVKENSPDIVYPIVAPTSATELYHFYFIPIFGVQSAHYLSLRHSNEENMKKMIESCLKMWPLLTVCLLISLMSGFVMWCIEVRGNTSEFSRRFHVGLFEGFWWSFVSITTVGYGDKTPRSPVGRLFAVVCIIVGIAVCSICVATLTTAILEVYSKPDTEMAGTKVGVLQYRLEDATMVVQHGGILQEIEYNDTISGILELLDKLQNKDVHGILIHKDAHHYFLRQIRKEKYKDQRERIKNIHVHKSDVLFRGDKLSFGILIKNREDYVYFKKYFESNRLQLEACISVKWNQESIDYKLDDDEVLPEGGLFDMFLYYSLGILGGITCFGICDELKMLYERKRHGAPMHDIGTITSFTA